MTEDGFFKRRHSGRKCPGLKAFLWQAKKTFHLLSCRRDRMICVKANRSQSVMSMKRETKLVLLCLKRVVPRPRFVPFNKKGAFLFVIHRFVQIKGGIAKHAGTAETA
ncbi:hypothetical protein TH62_16440 [Bacillus sp. TH008]|nr:hypothetical protein TH62_16440 [Bacillus sp. TH008]